jgi:SAM-dependent methyltransferase
LEGNKTRNGLYYTPPCIVDDIAKEYASKSSKFLDPCCGSGQFLLAVADIVKDPNNLFGIDIDEIAVRVARINMLIKFKDICFVPNIYHKNALFDLNANDSFNKQNYKLNNFDLIATNPPWGVHFLKEDKVLLREQYAHIDSFESFSYFLSKSIDLLKENGILSFILPESILNVGKHRDIRKLILNNCCIEKIVCLDRIFKNVFTPVIRLDIRKMRKDDNIFLIFKNDKSYKLKQEELLKNQDFVFDIHSNNLDSNIINKIYSVPHLTLKDKSDWALGIVTGDNEKYVHSNKEEGFEEVFKGKDVERFVFKPATSYIHFTPNKFQQVAPEVKYRAKEKLIYRFISKYLIFAYDDKQRLTLNSANILIPQLDNYPIKVIAALFNSSLYQFIFQKKFASIKVLKSHLEQLPLPLWDKGNLDKICIMVEQIIDFHYDTNELDGFIMKLFNLKDTEVSHIKESLATA